MVISVGIYSHESSSSSKKVLGPSMSIVALNYQAIWSTRYIYISLPVTCLECLRGRMAEHNVMSGDQTLHSAPMLSHAFNL